MKINSLIIFFIINLLSINQVILSANLDKKLDKNVEQETLEQENAKTLDLNLSPKKEQILDKDIKKEVLNLDLKISPEIEKLENAASGSIKDSIPESNSVSITSEEKPDSTGTSPSFDLGSMLSVLSSFLGSDKSALSKQGREQVVGDFKTNTLKSFKDILYKLKSELDKNTKEIELQYNKEKELAENIAKSIKSGSEDEDSDAGKRISEKFYIKALKSADKQKDESLKKINAEVQSLFNNIREELQSFIDEQSQALKSSEKLFEKEDFLKHNDTLSDNLIDEDISDDLELEVKKNKKNIDVLSTETVKDDVEDAEDNAEDNNDLKEHIAL